MIVWIVRKKGRQDRVAGTALIVIPDIDDRLLFREEPRALLVAAPLKWIKLRNLELDRVDLSKDQSRFLSDKLRV